MPKTTIQPEIETSYMDLLSLPLLKQKQAKELIIAYQEWQYKNPAELVPLLKGEPKAERREIHGLYIRATESLEAYDEALKEIKKVKIKGGDASELLAQKDQLLVEHFFFKAIAKKLEDELKITESIAQVI